MPTPPLVNPAIEAGFWIHVRYAADAADGAVSRQLLFAWGGDKGLPGRSLVDPAGRRDTTHLDDLLLELGYFPGARGRPERRLLAGLLSTHLLSFDALAGRLVTWLFGGGAEGVPEVNLRIELEPESDFELTHLTLELGENHGLGGLRSWSYGVGSLLSLSDEGSGMPMMTRFDNQVERFMMGLARDLEGRRRLRP